MSKKSEDRKTRNISESTDNCVVCCREVRIYAVGDCDHHVCYECATRMRVVCGQKECPICRRELPKVIYLKKKKPYSSVASIKYQRKDKKHQIYFEDSDAEESHYKLLEHRCLMCPDEPLFTEFQLMKDHMRKEHERFYCDLCTDHLMIFTSERKYYTRAELALHRRAGDKDNTSHRGHPLCEFCDERFLDNDELYRHLRREHYFCHFCDADGFHHYYSDYEYLRKHFRAEHYLCEEDDCERERFTTAFRSVIDLKAHKAAVHSKNMTKAQSKQTRTLELEFSLKPRTKAAIAAGLGGASTSGSNYSYVDGSETRDVRSRQGGYGNDTSNIEAASSVQSEDEPSVKKPPIEIKPEDFPTLGQVNPHAGMTAASNNTLARKLAKSNNMSTGCSTMSEGDFPALGSRSDSSAKSSKFLAQAASSSSSPLSAWPSSSGTTSLSVTTSRTPASSIGGATRNKVTVKLNSKEDFPSLSSKGGMAKSAQPCLSVQLSHTQKVVPDGHRSGSGSGVKTTSSRAKSQASVPPPAEQPTKITTSKNLTLLNVATGATKRFEDHQSKRVLKNGSSKTDPGWEGLKAKKESGNNKKVDLMDEDEFPPLDTKGKNSVVPNKENASSDIKGAWKTGNANEVDATRSHQMKKKNQKESCKADGESSSRNQAPKNEKNNIPEPSKKKKQSSQPSSASTNVVNGAMYVENQENVMPTGKAEKSPKRKGERLAMDLDCVPFSVAATASNNGFNNVTSYVDFPSLPMTLSKQRLKTPPGFSAVSAVPSNAATSGPPPGFLPPKKLSKPPPGFDVSANLVTFTNSSGEDFTYPLTIHEYVMPEGFQTRNQKLMEQLMAVLANNNDKFSEFRSHSRDFRKGDITAADYYKHCKRIIGKAKFLKVLPELIVLLPDIGKQQQLLAIHNVESNVKSSKKSAADGNVAMQFLVCATCQQVLSAEDFRMHMDQHSFAVEFPPLQGSHSLQRSSQATWFSRS